MSYPWHWSHFWDKYPYTDFHELNLDWLIHQMKYWYKCIEYVQQAIATGTEDHNKYYDTAHKSSDLIWWNDEFYRLTKDVAAGDDIDCNSLEHISVEDLLDEEEAARKAADAQLQSNIDAEADAREAADDALGKRIDNEITDRTNADANLQTQISSNDSDIANLQSCCSTVQSTIADHETRITNNTTNITKNTTDIQNIINGTSEDTNTITQLTYYEWRGTVFQGSETSNTGVSRLTAMKEVAAKVASIVAEGGHAELCRIQLYGGTVNAPSVFGLNGSNFLNTQSGGYRYSTTSGSIVPNDCSITDSQISSTDANNYVRSWYYSGSASTWTYSEENLTAVYNSSGFYWQYRLVYQTADYISA